MMELGMAKGFALVTAVGGMVGGALAAIQTHLPLPGGESVGGGAIGGAAISAAAWAVLRQDVQRHGSEIDKLHERKADHRSVESMVKPLHETLEQLREDMRWLRDRLDRAD